MYCTQHFICCLTFSMHWTTRAWSSSWLRPDTIMAPGQGREA